MERVVATIALDPDLVDAEVRLAEYFENLRVGNGRIVVHLRLALEDLGFPAPLLLSHRAALGVKRQRGELTPRDTFAIEWRPLDSALFPSLRGRLAVWPGTEAVAPYLELQGVCTASSLDQARAYDATIGRLIAKRAAAAFLEDAAAGIRPLRGTRTPA